MIPTGIVAQNLTLSFCIVEHLIHPNNPPKKQMLQKQIFQSNQALPKKVDRGFLPKAKAQCKSRDLKTNGLEGSLNSKHIQTNHSLLEGPN